MTAARQQRIARAFDAASDYDGQAVIQRRVAETLADRIAALPIIAERGFQLRLLEIGCGTGFLTRALQQRGVPGHWLVTDIAPAMLARCIDATSGREGPASLRYATMDGERPDAGVGGGFDIICSSMAFQWFDDLGTALGRLASLLAPQGALIFSTLLSGTFAEWNDAHPSHGLQAGGLRFPLLENLPALLPRGGALKVDALSLQQRHASAAAFLRSLKRIGAGTASADYRPLSAPDLRRVMASFAAAGCAITYRIALCDWVRENQAFLSRTKPIHEQA